MVYIYIITIYNTNNNNTKLNHDCDDAVTVM